MEGAGKEEMIGDAGRGGGKREDGTVCVLFSK